VVDVDMETFHKQMAAGREALASVHARLAESDRINALFFYQQCLKHWLSARKTLSRLLKI